MTVDFYYRFLSLCLLMLSFSMFIGSVALLPAYFSSTTKNSIAELKLKTQQNTKVPLLGQESLATIEDMNNKLSTIENAEKNQFLVSGKVINEIISNRITGIKIIQISYENDGGVSKKINILGAASSREVLLAFEQALENNQAFKNVNLPISSFVKDSNIQFTLSLNPS